MSFSGIQGHLLQVTVVGCTNLKNTEWISRQDPYVCLEYGSTQHRTSTCTDGGKMPIFQEKFTFSLIEGLREINVIVWNSNTVTYDDFIGTGKVQLQRVLSYGYDDNPWPLQTKTGRYAGEARLIMRYEKAQNPVIPFAPSAPPYAISPYQFPPHSTLPQSYPTPSPYPAYPSYPSSMYPPPSTYPPPSAYPPPPLPSAYPPASPYYPPRSRLLSATAVLKHPPQEILQLAELRGLWVRISLDGVGTINGRGSPPVVTERFAIP